MESIATQHSHQHFSEETNDNTCDNNEDSCPLAHDQLVQLLTKVR